MFEAFPKGLPKRLYISSIDNVIRIGITHRVGAPIRNCDRGKPGADLGLPQPLGAVVGPLGQPAGLV